MWHIYASAQTPRRPIFFLALSIFAAARAIADSSPPLRPRHPARHTEDAAATPPDAGRRHRLACVRGPRARVRRATAARDPVNPAPTSPPTSVPTTHSTSTPTAPTTALVVGHPPHADDLAAPACPSPMRSSHPPAR